mmetsp:Transcript_10548/g.20284  ORF Transcript_10548/g.20284 Transcript_10548/m.20284 type:complete len:323 (-) Transcript_10548:820-1788(-)
MQSVRNSQNNLDTNHIGQAKCSKHAGKGRIGCHGPHTQDRQRRYTSSFGTLNVGCLVINYDRFVFFFLLFDNRGSRWQGSRVHEFSIFYNQHTTDSFIFVINIVIPSFLGRLRSNGKQKLGNVIGIQRTGRTGQSGRQVRVAQTNDTIVCDDAFILDGRFNVSTCFGGQIYRDTTWFHDAHHFLGHHGGCLSPGDECRSNHNIHFLALFRQHGSSGSVPFGRHFLGVSTGSTSVFLKVDFKEGGSHGFDLFLGDGSHIKGLDGCSHVLGGLHGRQTCHTGTNDQHFGGWYFTGGRHLSRHESSKFIGSFQDGPVPTNIGLRR